MVDEEDGGDDGHIMPDDVWAEVVNDAERIDKEQEEGAQ